MTLSNFTFLAKHDEKLSSLGEEAERFFPLDANTCLFKLRLLAERMALIASANTGGEVSFAEALQDLQYSGRIDKELADRWHGIRKAGNEAVHDHNATPSEALHQMKMTRLVAIWFHRTFKHPKFKPMPFIPPKQPEDAASEIVKELDEYKAMLDAKEQMLLEAEQAKQAQQEELQQLLDQLAAFREDAATWQSLAEEEALHAQELQEKLQQASAAAEAMSGAEVAEQIEIAQTATQATEYDEKDTRRIIDEQLRAVGWVVDSDSIRHGHGHRPEKHVNKAIAEWPTKHGPADYVLFIGLQPVAIVEAKKLSVDVPGVLTQSFRYSRDFQFDDDHVEPGGPWSDEGYRIPFVFATNGRPYLRQLETKSGVWFRDLRIASTSRALDGWYSPAGLKDLLAQDFGEAHASLKAEPFDYLQLRHYQVEAIQAVEAALEKDQRRALLAMATGTGKTRTALGLVYRLVKARRFRRILFLVDRSSLGDQAAGAFNDVRLEDLKTFAEIYGVKGLEDIEVDDDTKLHIRTVQGMVQSLLYTSPDKEPPSVDTYDCIIVDEAHRGYNLDREMSDVEMSFRDEADYISKYRRVIDHFDAVKIALTATPAIHTSEIFGKPVYTYGYREAVIDGYLVDHEPPTRIATKLALEGIKYSPGDEATIYDYKTGKTQLELMPDELEFEIDHFNKSVVNPNFNKVICEELAQHIDPYLEGKTLIFCVRDDHADQVVAELRKAWECPDEVVQKITGATDKPAQMIRRFKNEMFPSVGVTVDLLTTGIDVPQITNLVFLRRTRSRILYEQMLGRATRLCPDIGKESFKVYDAVQLYEALEPVSAMKPVVQSVSVSFDQLVKELFKEELKDNEEARKLVVEQLAVKLRRRKQHLDEEGLLEFEAETGRSFDALVDEFVEQGPDFVEAYFREKPEMVSFLRDLRGAGRTAVLDQHSDVVVDVSTGFPEGMEPDEYLKAFAAYIEANVNKIAALKIVTQRPRDLTRKDLKELMRVLDAEGYTEAYLRAAHKILKNEDIAATIIGFVRQQALGDPLIPYDQRVDEAMKRLLADREWTAAQKKWLERIAKQLKEEVVVDHDALDRGAFKNKGGFKHLNKVFGGQLDALLLDFREQLWQLEGESSGAG